MNRKFLYKALQKLKEELLLMGFISLLLARLQDEIVKVCIPASWATKGLPCNPASGITDIHTSTTAHFSTGRHLLAEGVVQSYCQQKGKVPLLSYHALHDLHILIFILAVVHVVVCALTVLLGAIKISQWRKWEEEIIKNINCSDNELRVLDIKNDSFIKNRFMGTEARKRIWLQSFAKHLYGSVSESDYFAMRTGFIMTHCRDNPNFNFYDYMIRAFEADFAKVISISWYVWVIVVISLLLNLAGWHMYFWIAFLPLTLLLILGTKLEQVITVLATEVVSRHSEDVEEIQIQPSDHYFWFNKPKITLLLINVILSCNSFAVALFFWIYTRYGFHPCSMERNIFTIPRLIIVIIVQILLSYSTLPLYAIVTQMGSSCHVEAMENSDFGSIDGDAHTRRGFGSMDMSEEAVQPGKKPEAKLEVESKK
ncbi:MLO-like protein 15 [Silene latifolia]|uniref:MLO-like protein 15 n=1 Tax=Silene latifolia TaxID=37657 RepID=UPI003D76B059